MRGVSNLLPAIVLSVGLFALLTHAQANAEGGLTLTPATLTLTLAKGSMQTTREFSLANHYERPLALHFAFEPTPGSADSRAVNFLRLTYSDLTIPAGESARQTIAVSDDEQLTPGSHTLELVITQLGSSGSHVNVNPSIRMPLVVVKEDGATNSITLSSSSAPRFGLVLPGALSVTAHNTGNTVAIPRGVITVTAMNGSVVRRGVINTASQAVSPGGSLAFDTPLVSLGAGWLPGVYRTNISLGLGGGQASQTVGTWFLYVAWWHLLALMAIGATFYYYRQKILALLARPKKKPPARRPPTKRVLIGGRA